jgi:hypothetical protein
LHQAVIGQLDAQHHALDFGVVTRVGQQLDPPVAQLFDQRLQVVRACTAPNLSQQVDGAWHPVDKAEQLDQLLPRQLLPFGARLGIGDKKLARRLGVEQGQTKQG